MFLGNLVQVKRADLAVAAFLPLAGQAVLELWGQGPPDQSRSLLESLAACPHIRYRGPYRREDLPGILAGAAAVVVPSDFENCPLVVREALMLKVPVIASRVGGIPEIVRRGENGLLFPAGIADALRRQALRLIHRPQLVARLRQGILPVKTMAQEARELLDLYRSWIANLFGADVAEVTIAEVVTVGLDATAASLGSISVADLPSAWATTAIDVVDTTLGPGRSLVFYVNASGPGVYLGNVRVMYTPVQ